ncbi:MAG: aspartate aminotransferase family protein [Desulfurococcales archaeon]|nr:aspartate aminotransferase family protein [Desulfurococcales archaeon]
MPGTPPIKKKEVLNSLKDLLSKDMDPHSGRLWSYVYETGVSELRELAEESYILSLWRNMLDPTVFPSVLELEKSVVSFVAGLFGAPDTTVGNFTSGGTESNFMAVLAAREWFYAKNGRSGVPKLIAPATVHPSVIKSAWLLGVKPVLTPVDSEYKANVDELVSNVDDSTALVVLSSPNYPFGTFDPVRDVAEFLEKKNVWLHVDSCLGFAIPFARMNGRDIPLQGLNIERVDSMSVDLHKLGYAPRGSSTILYRDRDRRKNAFFVYSKWPGYPIVNQILLSSRTSGPLAASWSLIKALGVEGYKTLTRYAFDAREKLIGAMVKQGFRVEGNPPYIVLAFSHGELDLVDFSRKAGEKHWHVQVQPGSKKMGYPMTVHFTVTPVHISLVNGFARDLDEIVSETRKLSELGKDPMLEALKTVSPSEVSTAAPLIMQLLGGSGGGLEGADLSFISRYIYELDPDVVEALFREVSNALL